MPIPLGRLKHPSNGGHYLGGGGGKEVHFFTLEFFPAHPSYMSVITNNGTLQGQEDRSHQDGTRVLHVPKGQGGQVHIVTHPHPHVSSWKRILFFGGGTSATASIASTVVTAASHHQVCEGFWENGANLPSPLQIDHNQLEREMDVGPQSIKRL